MRERMKMSDHPPDKSDRNARFAPAKAPLGSPVLDEAGHAIIAMLQKAAEASKEECARAMDLAHRLSFELRAAEERARVAEAEAARFRDRATQAEGWLLRIRNELDQTLLQRQDPEPRPAPPVPPAPPPAARIDPYAPPYVRRGQGNGGD